MAAENGVGGISEFGVDKGKQVDEKENDEEIAEISLSPDLEAEEARKEELRLQAQKVKRCFSSEIICLTRHMQWKRRSTGYCSLDVVHRTS